MEKVIGQYVVEFTEDFRIFKVDGKEIEQTVFAHTPEIMVAEQILKDFAEARPGKKNLSGVVMQGIMGGSVSVWKIQFPEDVISAYPNQ